MPQIWMTYEELGSFLDCDAYGARDHAIGEAFARRRSRDGVTRVKLSDAAMAAFLDRSFTERLSKMQASASRIHTIQALAEEFASSGSGRTQTPAQIGRSLINVA